MTGPILGNSLGGNGSGPGNVQNPPGSGDFYIDPLVQPDQKTLVYAPQVRILIARGNKQYDVSADITRGGIIKRENAASSLQFSLANRKSKYNGKFMCMDRVVVFMKRISWVQVFSGYLDSVPHASLYGGEANYRATCTIKRLMHTWWNPSLQKSQALLQSASIAGGVNGDGQLSLDAGMGNLLRRLLHDVGGWDHQDIHIQHFPMEFLAFAQANLSQMGSENARSLEEFKTSFLGSGDTSIGVGAAASRQGGIQTGTYSMGAQFYVAEIIRAADAYGLGPVTADLQRSQDMARAAQQGNSSPTMFPDQGWPAMTEVTQEWMIRDRTSDGAILGVACALGESSLLMRANLAVPDSLNFPHEAMSSDHDSIGLFQQRANGAWGSTAQRMNPYASAAMFFAKLSTISGWRNMDPGQAIFQVQIGGSPGYYNGFIAQATALVQAARGQVGNMPVVPGLPGLGSSTSTSLPLPTSPAGIISQAQSALGNVPGAGGVGPAQTSPGPALLNGEIANATSRPSQDAQGAVNAAMTQIATPYKYGGTTWGAALDCSALLWLSYRAIGVEIPRTSGAQAVAGQAVPAAQVQPGDVFANAQHAFMCIAPGMVIDNGGPEGTPPKVRPITPDDLSGRYAIRRFATWGGPGAATFTIPTLTGAGTPPGVSGTGGQAGTGTTGASEPIARNLFTYQFLPQNYAGDISPLLGGEKSFIYAQPLLQMIQSVCRGSLRSFASAPDGSFAAYYPDYFGLQGKPCFLNLEDIEMKNVKVDVSDDSLATHVYVVGAESAYNPTITPAGWIQSSGVATVENQWLFRMMASATPNVMGGISGSTLMRQFGVRPLIQEFPGVVHGPMEFFLSVQLFMQKWAEQFQTAVSFTFMPELFPGMRINLVKHNIQLYVAEVEHSWDFEQGGFTTNAVIMAPTSSNNKGLIQDEVTGGNDPNAPLDNTTSTPLPERT